MNGRTAYPDQKISETFLHFAAPILVSVTILGKKKLSRASAYTMQSWFGNLVQFYQACGKSEKAAEWRKH